MSSKLTYLRVDQFRHVQPGTTLEFGPRINAFVGRNGAGKTTLLALISAIIRNNFHQFIDESFSLNFRLVDGEYELEGTLENTVEQNREERMWPRLTFSGVFRHADRAVHIKSDASDSALSYSGRQYQARSLIPGYDATPTGLGLIARVRLALASIEGLSDLFGLSYHFIANSLRSLPFVCTRFGEGVETFRELFVQGQGHHEYGRATSDLFYVSSADLANTLHTPSVLDGFLGEWKAMSDDVMVVAADEAPPLARFVELSQYTDARLILTKTSATTVYDGATRHVYANPLARFTTLSGNEISHHQLSFGEKRLLAFLIKLYGNPSNIIVDELANGMHHSWLERTMELLEELDTQAFLSSQNPLLLDCLPLSRETHGELHQLIICELGESGEMIWRNLSGAETTDFFKSLEVGLQHVSEIMRDKGLW